MAKFVFDRKKGAFVPKYSNFGALLLAILRYLLASLLLAVLFYAVFALTYSTDREKLLERENQLLKDEYASLSGRLDVLDGAVGDLQVRDREIYHDLFSADPPNYIFEAKDTLLRSVGELQEMQEEDLIWDGYALTNRIESMSRLVSAALAEIDTVLARRETAPTAIPSVVPVKDFSPRQTGASVGRKINPFYKTVREHNGLDIVAPAGTPVFSSADGKVTKVEKSEKGMGNQVTVEHPGGFQTVYAHLGKVSVGTGQAVKQGTQLGTVGQSGSCFAPCLHYELYRNGFVQDPVNYFFAEFSPAVYRDMLIVALTTGQSLD